MNTEKWNEICFLLSEHIQKDISESQFELNIIQALRVLGWKEFSGDIAVRNSIQVGAANRITPDIIVKSGENQKLFVIEIKQPNIPFNTKFQQQLFSYMRLLKMDYGLLIGQGIQVFYDGALSNQDDPILLETIRFERNSEKGEQFVELFGKDTFSFESLEAFVLQAIKKINLKLDFKILTDRILSEDFLKNVPNLIKQEFINEYDGELIDSVLEGLEIEIHTKNQTHQPVINSVNESRNVAGLQNTFRSTSPGSKISPITEKRTVNGKKIGQFVQDSFRELYKNGFISQNEIKNLQDKSYCKAVFGQSIEVLRHGNIETRDKYGNNRFYAKEYFCGNYHLNSQWNESHWERFLAWMRKIQKQNNG